MTSEIMLNLFPPLHIVELSVSWRPNAFYLFMFKKKKGFQYEELVNEGANPS